MVEGSSSPKRWYAATLRLTVLAGIVAALILPALVLTQRADAAGALAAPPDGDTYLHSGCTYADANNATLSNDNGPVEFQAGSVAGYAGGGVLKARASAMGDDCAMTVTFSDTITIGAGSSGLPQGAPVTLLVTLAVAGTLSVDAGSGYAEATGDLDYMITDVVCPEGCESAVWFSASVQNQSYAGDAYGKTSWDLMTNTGVDLGSYTNGPSGGVNTGTHTVAFSTVVGETLDISAQLNAFATGNNGGTAISDFYDLFSSTRIVPAAGFEGVSVIYGSEPAPNQAPSVDAAGPYTVNEGEAVQVSATGTDPDGDTLTYAWDLNNDGTFETAGQSATFSAAGINGPAMVTIAVQATDVAGNVATDVATVEVLDVAPAGPAQMIGELAVAVDGANLHHGIENALLEKLRNAKTAVETGKTNDACGNLKAFANQVNAQKGKKIGAAQADAWFSEATEIRAVLGCE